MSNPSRPVRTLAVLAALLSSAHLASANTALWVGTPGGSATTNWSDTLNWNNVGAGGTGPNQNDVFFGGAGSVGTAGFVNNVVDANGLNPSSLSYTNGPGQYHTTLIPAGVTMTDNNGFLVGGYNVDGAATTVNMTGGGTFQATGTSFKVGNAGSSGTSTLNATLDMSTLSTFVYNASGGTWTLAGSGGDARAGGVLNLAGTSNNITVGTINFNTGGGNNSGFRSLLQFGGGTNILNVGTLVVCQTKAQYAQVQFLSGTPATAGLRLRGVNGNSDDTSRATITLGDRNNSGSGNTEGDLFLNGHPVDIKAGTLTVGQDRTGSGTSTHGGIGVVQFDTGTLDATTVTMANSSGAGGTPAATGTLTVGANGTLRIGTGGLSLANQARGTATGTLNINGGTVLCSGNITKATAAGTGTIALNGGSLTMVNTANTIGTTALPIDNVNPTNATLHFALDGNGAATRTNIAAATINAGGITTIQVDSIANVSGNVTFHIARATSAFNGNIGNFAVANPLPGGRIGILSLNNNTLELTVLPAGGTGRTLTWEGNLTGDWDLATQNWQTNGVATAFQQTDAVLLNDSMTGARSLNLTPTTTLVPFSITVNNSMGNYTFGGGGMLGGTGGLLKQGSSALILDNGQPNNFTGGITISGGTLQVGNADAKGNLPAGSPVTNNAALVFNRTDAITVPNNISGSGTITQNGAGTVTLSGANPCTGATVVNAGGLVLNGTLGGALTSSSGTTLAGTGTCTGLVSVAGSLLPGTAGVPGTFTANGGLALQPGAALTFDLASINTINSGVNDLLQVNGNLTANNNTININLLSSPQPGSPYRLINYTGTKTGSFNASVSVIGGTHCTPTLDQSTPNQVNLTFSGGATLLWTGANGGTWDVGTTASWFNQSSSVSPDFFYQGDSVLFDDTLGSPAFVNLGSTVVPTLVSVNATANTFYLGTSTDPGRITGAASIVKNGASNLLLGTSNDFTGTITVNAGILVVGSPSALGATNGGTILNSGASLDLYHNTVLGEPITISGPGAGDGNGTIFNSGASLTAAISRLTLAGDTSIGGTGVQGLGGNLAGRWDIRATSSGATDPALSTLSTGGHPYKLNKVGPNYTAICNTTIDPALAEIDIQGGTLSFQYNDTCLGDPTKTLTVEQGASLDFYNLTNQANKVFVLNGNSSTTNLNNGSGANTLIGPMTFNDGCLCYVGGTSLTLNGPIGGSGSISKGGTSPLYLNGPITYSGSITVGAGKLVLNNHNSGGGTLTGQIGTTIAGNGTNDGIVDISGTLLPGDANAFGSFGAGTLTMESGASVTFDIGTTTTMDSGSNDLVQVTGDLNLNNTPIIINVLRAPPQLGTYRLINYGGNLNGSFDTSNVTNYLHYTFRLDTSTPHQVNLVVSGGPALLVWDSTADTAWAQGGTTANWSNTVSHVATDYYYDGDGVLLTDLPGVVSAITLNTTVQPATMTVDASANDFSIAGSGKISGAVGLSKGGSSTLTLGTTNDFTGPVTVLAGTLKVTSSAALGATNGGTTIAPGATLDLGANLPNNGLNLGLESITVSGQGVGNNGAIINSGTNSQQNALRLVTLVGDTWFGGPGQFNPANNVGRWDMRGTGAVLNTGGNAYNLTKVGNNQVNFVGVTMDTNLANIDIQAGDLGFETTTTSMGNPANTLTVRAGATMSFYNSTSLWNKVFMLYGDGVNTNIFNWSGSNTMVGPVTLNGLCVVAVPSGSLALYGPLNGSGGLTKLLGGTVYLYGANTYSGNTVVNGDSLALVGSAGLSNSPVISIATGATLDVSARSDQKLTLNSGQTLNGSGTVNPNLVIGANATVAPGSGTTIGTLTVAGIANLQGTTLIKLDKSQAQTSDRLAATSGILPGGTLLVTNANPAAPLAGGDVFTLFSAPFWFPGSFSISPASPGPGLAWDTSTLTSDGKLRVVATVNPLPGYVTNSIAGNQLTLSWSSDRIGWALETNALGLGNPSGWFRLPGSETNNQVIIPINPASPQVFFRMVYP